MSYDLMVFDPESAPLEREEFLKWFEAQTEWAESHGYDDPKLTCGRLRSWFLEMITAFPPMNGPLSTGDSDNSRTTDYSIGRTVIYAAFAWSQAQAAYSKTIELAQRHSVGFFDVSGSNAFVWHPPAGPAFRCFFTFYGTDQSVASESPVLLDRASVIAQLIPALSTDRDFLGVIDSKDTTLQVMFHEPERRFWVEIPVPDEGGSYGAYFAKEDLETLFKGLPSEFSPSQFSVLSFEAW